MATKQTSPAFSETFTERLKRVLPEELSRMSLTQLKRLDMALDRRLKQVDGDHLKLSDEELRGLAQSVETCFPKAFQIASQQLKATHRIN
jgi:hypothetical protein